jgi:hypothetical protein
MAGRHSGYGTASTPRLLSQQAGQLRDIRRNPAGLVLRQQVRRRSPSWLFLKIDVGQRLLVVVTHDEAGVVCLVDSSRAAESGGAGRGG